MRATDDSLTTPERRELNKKLLRNDELFVEGAIEKDSYNRLKADLTVRRAEAESDLARAEKVAMTSADDVGR